MEEADRGGNVIQCRESDVSHWRDECSAHNNIDRNSNVMTAHYSQPNRDIVNM